MTQSSRHHANNPGVCPVDDKDLRYTNRWLCSAWQKQGVRQHGISASSGINRLDMVGGQGAQVIGDAFGQGVQIIATFE